MNGQANEIRWTIAYQEGKNFPVHYLRTEEQFIDAMYRYSYLAKVDDKEGIRHKGFGVIKIATKSK